MTSPQLVLDADAIVKTARASAMIQITDLTGSPEKRSLWRRWRSGTESARTASAPATAGWPSPMGYWLTVGGERGVATASDTKIVQVLAPGEDSASDPVLEGSRTPSRLGRPPQTIRVKGPDGELVLTIGADGARVVATAAAWEALSEPVLLAACVYWRFQAIDAELDRLTVEAEHDLPHAAMAIPATLWSRKRLLGHARTIRALLIDLPHFEGPLTDPFPYLSNERAVQTFRSVAEKLHMEEWCESIDDRADAVEDTYASVTEKLNEFRNFMIGSILEVTIIVILLAELFVHTYDAISPG